MNPSKLQFLSAIVGSDGANALAKAVERISDLELAILPRAITAWLEIMGPFGYDGTVPGIENQLSFTKSEQGFSGYIVLDGQNHVFKKSSIFHVAGCMAVALGLDHERMSTLVKSEKLVKLGKGIDLLVKSKVIKGLVKGKKVKKAQINANSGGKTSNLPGIAAQPLAPKLPIPPTAEQPANEKQMPQGSAGTSTASPLPQVKTSSKPKASMKVTKAQSELRCEECAKTQFVDGKYRGCFCFSSLAKSVRTTPTETGYLLTFGSDWDQEALETLFESLHNK